MKEEYFPSDKTEYYQYFQIGNIEKLSSYTIIVMGSFSALRSVRITFLNI